jgi:hypothetical protein
MDSYWRILISFTEHATSLYRIMRDFEITISPPPLADYRQPVSTPRR